MADPSAPLADSTSGPPGSATSNGASPPPKSPDPLDAALAARFETTFRDVRGGVEIEYLTGEQVISRLLQVVGVCGWSFRILQHGIHAEADEVWVLGELRLLLDPEDPVVRQQFGSAKVKRARSTGVPLDIGFDLKSAATDCLKKCATLLGVGLYLTRKEEQAPPASEPGTPNRAPQGRSGIGPPRRPPPSAAPAGGTPARSGTQQRSDPDSSASAPHHLPMTARTGERSAAPAAPAGLTCQSCGQPLQKTTIKDGTEWTPAELAAYTRRKHNRTLCASCARTHQPRSAPPDPPSGPMA